MEDEDVSFFGILRGHWCFQECLHDALLGVEVLGSLDMAAFVFVRITTVNNDGLLDYMVILSSQNLRQCFCRDSLQVGMLALDGGKAVLLREISNQVRLVSDSVKGRLDHGL